MNTLTQKNNYNNNFNHLNGSSSSSSFFNNNNNNNQSTSSFFGQNQPQPVAFSFNKTFQQISSPSFQNEPEMIEMDHAESGFPTWTGFQTTSNNQPKVERTFFENSSTNNFTTTTTTNPNGNEVIIDEVKNNDIYTPMANLTKEDLAKFKMEQFIDSIPLSPPPYEFCF